MSPREARPRAISAGPACRIADGPVVSPRQDALREKSPARNKRIAEDFGSYARHPISNNRGLSRTTNRVISLTMHTVFIPDIPLDISVISKLIDKTTFLLYPERAHPGVFIRFAHYLYHFIARELNQLRRSNQTDAIFTLIIMQHRLTWKLINF